MLTTRFLLPVTAVCVLAALVITPAAAAQDGPARGFARIGGGFQASSETLSDGGTFTANAETAGVSATHDFGSGAVFQVAAGGRIGSLLAVGLEVSRFSKQGDATAAALIPHPFFFNRLRPVSGVTRLEHTELAVHVQLGAILDPTPDVQVSLFAGPSFFQVTQQTVAGVDYTDAYPFDDASFAAARLHANDETAVGIHAGIDLAWFFSNRVGAGLSAQYAHGTVQLAGLTAEGIEATVGGARVGAGLRFRF